MEEEEEEERRRGCIIGIILTVQLSLSSVFSSNCFVRVCTSLSLSLSVSLFSRVDIVRNPSSLDEFPGIFLPTLMVPQHVWSGNV